MAAIEVVLFDVDDTLFAHAEAVHAGVTAHRARLGGALAAADDAVESARWTALEEHHYHRYLRGEVTSREQRRARARDFLAPYGLSLDTDADADAWFERYLAEYRTAWRLHDEVPAVLAALTQRLGVITNAELDFQLGKLEATGIRERFEHIIASGEVGFVKPDARLFAHAASLFGVSPGAAAYVGDRLETDALGAAGAGMLGVWVSRGVPSPADLDTAAAAGVSVVRSLAELPALLGA